MPRPKTIRPVALCATLLFLMSCDPSGVGPPDDPPAASVTLTVSASVGANVTGVSVEISAVDIDPPIVANLQVTDGTATGTVEVPAGSDRTVTVRAFDNRAIETHAGSVVIDVLPGQSTSVTVTLTALMGDVPITATVATYGVTVDPSAVAIDLLETATLTATVTDGDGGVVADPELHWGSGNPVIAPVSADGIVTGGYPGAASVVVNYLGIAAVATVQVAGRFEEWFGGLCDAGVCAYNLGTGELRTIADGATRAPVWTKNGRLAYEDGAGGIEVQNFDGTGARTFSTDGSTLAYPAWAPGGERLAYARLSSTAFEGGIRAVDFDGSNATAVTTTPDGVTDEYPDWSPDGVRLVFARSVSGEGVALYTVGDNATGLTEIVEPGFPKVSPRWSPAGARIAFLEDFTVDGRLEIVDDDGSNRTRIGGDSLWVLPRYAWSPSGDRLAMEGWVGSNALRDIFIVNADGSGLTRVTPTDEFEFFAGWSPDGTRLAFWRDGVFLSVRPDGSDEQPLIDGGVLNERTVHWFRRVVFDPPPSASGR